MGFQNMTSNMGNSYHNALANAANTSLCSMEILAHKMHSLEQQFSNLQVSNTKKAYSMEYLCPYPSDRSIYMPPFPQNYNVPNFNKYKGKGSPIEHVQEFHTACLELAFDQTYLMRLFPQSLVGQALKWFTHLPPGIRTWTELVDKFIAYFSYNIETDMNVATLCHTKQDDGESFLSFFQRWRSLASKCPCHMLENQLVPIFVESLNTKLMHQLQIHCCTTFGDVVEKEIAIKKALIAKGAIKIFNKNQNNQNTSHDKNKFWSRN